MRINLTKKDLVNLVYMQIGFSKQISESLIDEFFVLIVSNLKEERKLKISKFGTFSLRLKKSRVGRNPKTKEEKKLKLSKFGTFSIRQKKSRIGRNPKTKESKVISSREVVLFKPSKEFKEFINIKENG